MLNGVTDARSLMSPSHFDNHQVMVRLDVGEKEPNQ